MTQVSSENESTTEAQEPDDQEKENIKLLNRVRDLEKKISRLKNANSNAVKRRRQELGLKPYQAELIQMQKYLEEQGLKMIVVFEGRDASGKGGTIRRVTRYMNEKHYRVVALAKPTEHERSQIYLQRYITQFPRGGEVVLFDRSWYNRAMVEPVFDFCTKEEYKVFMSGISGFEKGLTKQGVVLVKLYFSVTKEEQARRFERRKTDPLRQWKLSEVDRQVQDKWDEFTEQKYKMLRKTHTIDTPWTVIRSNNKFEARLNAMRVILNSVPYEKKPRRGVHLIPDPEIVISGAREIELMEAERMRVGSFTE